MALIEVRNEAQQMQFTEEQYPLNLKEKIVVNTTGFGTAVTRGGNISSSRPIVYYRGSVAINSTKGLVATKGIPYHTVERISNGSLTLVTNRGSGADITIYIFDKGTVSPSDDGGLAVWGPDGTLAFTANDKPVRVVATVPYAPRGSGGYLTNPINSYQDPQGRQIAFIHNMQAYVNAGENQDESVGFRSLQKALCNTVGASWGVTYFETVRIRLTNQGDDITPFVNDQGMATIIDVTNF